MPLLIPKRVKPVVDFAVQIAIGAAAFAVVFFVAVALTVLIKFVERFTVLPMWLERSVDYVEIGIWSLDLVGLALFLISEIATLACKLWIDWKDGHG